jgi:hypothetical protein
MLNYQRVLHNWENRHPSGPSNSYFRVPFWCLLQGKSNRLRPSQLPQNEMEKWRGFWLIVTSPKYLLVHAYIVSKGFANCLASQSSWSQQYPRILNVIHEQFQVCRISSRTYWNIEHNCTTEHTHLRQTIKHCITGNSRILNWRYCIICLAIFWYSLKHRPEKHRPKIYGIGSSNQSVPELFQPLLWLPMDDGGHHQAFLKGKSTN